MITAGIIAEYNPFHSGHKYHMEETRRRTGADYIVIAMSGDFVQRGEPASADKYFRTRMALQGGADVVLELPAIYATSSAQYFASAGVRLLDQLQCVDYLSFGSEWADLDKLQNVVNVLTKKPEKYYLYLKESLQEGKNFPSARSNALKVAFRDDALSEEVGRMLMEPNHILALEYLGCLQQQGSSMTPLVIRREGAAYHEENVRREHPSATALRGLLSVYKDYQLSGIREKNASQVSSDRQGIAGQIVGETASDPRSPKSVKKEFTKKEEYYKKIFQYNFGELAEEYVSRYLSGDMVNWEDLMPYLRYTFLMEREGIARYLGMDGDRTARFCRVFRPEMTFPELLENLHARSDTDAAWRRALLHMVLQMESQPFLADALEAPVPYARILGFSRKAAPLLKKMRECARVPLIQRPVEGRKIFRGDAVTSWMYSMDMRAAQLYEQIAAGKSHRKSVSEWSRQQVIVD